MPDSAAGDLKSPKTPRKVKTVDNGDGVRQVRFEGAGAGGERVNVSKSSGPKPASQQQQAPGPGGISGTYTAGVAGPAGVPPPSDNQPASFPQVGAPPSSGAFGSGPWHTAADPTQSLSSQPGGGFASATAGPGPGPGPGLAPTHFFHPAVHPSNPAGFHLDNNNNACNWLPHLNAPPIPYIGQLPPQQFVPQQFTGPAASMANYQNAAPQPTGVNFQPPVPDTTFGPIPHVYVPRFDGAPVYGAQVGYPFVHYVSDSASAPVHVPGTFTVIMPKTFYLNGYTYYASYIPWAKLAHSLLSLKVWFSLGYWALLSPR